MAPKSHRFAAKTTTGTNRPTPLSYACNDLTAAEKMLLSASLSAWTFQSATTQPPRTDTETTAHISIIGPHSERLEYDLAQLNGKSSVERGLREQKEKTWSWSAQKKRLNSVEQSVTTKWSVLVVKIKGVCKMKRKREDGEISPPEYESVVSVQETRTVEEVRTVRDARTGVTTVREFNVQQTRTVPSIMDHNVGVVRIERTLA